MGFLPSRGKSGKRMIYGIFAITWQKWQKDDFCTCHHVAKSCQMLPDVISPDNVSNPKNKTYTSDDKEGRKPSHILYMQDANYIWIRVDNMFCM